MKRTKATALATTAILGMGSVPGTATAASVVLDFEGFDHGRIIDTEYRSQVSVGAVNRGGGPDLAVVYDSSRDVADPTDADLMGPFTSADPGLPDHYEPGNLLIIQENGPCDGETCSSPDDEGSRPAGYFTFDFGSPVRIDSLEFFDIEPEEDGTTADNAIRLFDSAGGELQADTFFTPDTGGDNRWDRLSFGVDGVSRMEVRLGGSGAIDNLAYSTVVPLPGTFGLLAGGLAAVGVFARRRA